MGIGEMVFGGIVILVLGMIFGSLLISYGNGIVDEDTLTEVCQKLFNRTDIKYVDETDDNQGFVCEIQYEHQVINNNIKMVN